MALIQPLNYKTIAIPQAFYIVVMPQIDVSGKTMSFAVWPFASKTAAADNANLLSDAAIGYSGVPYDLDGENPFIQAYAYLKGLPEFTNAIDE